MVLGARRHHCDVHPGDRNSTHFQNHYAFNFKPCGFLLLLYRYPIIVLYWVFFIRGNSTLGGGFWFFSFLMYRATGVLFNDILHNRSCIYTNGHNDAARIITILYYILASAKHNTRFFKPLYPSYIIKNIYNGFESAQTPL